MNLTIWTLAILVPPLILIEGFFSGSEIALLSADKLALKRQSKHGDHLATLALEMANHPERVLSTTLLMTSLCVITTSALISLHFLERSVNHSEFFAVLVTSPIVVLFGELLPKSIYQRNATQLARWVAYPVYWVYWFFFPITRILASYTTRLSRIIGPIEELLSGQRKSTREEIRALLSYTKK